MPKTNKVTELTSAEMVCLYGLAHLTREHGSREGGFPALSNRQVSETIMHNGNLPYTMKILASLLQKQAVGCKRIGNTAYWYILPIVYYSIIKGMVETPFMSIKMEKINGNPD